jgi:poly(3-hydroxybutyrate) depolymerase
MNTNAADFILQVIDTAGIAFLVVKANGSSGTLATGSVTASVNNELYIAAAGFDQGSAAPSIDSSFTITDTRFYVSGQSEGGSMAYYVQSTAGAINPTWTFSGAFTNSAAIATFKPAAGGGGTVRRRGAVIQ